MNLPVIILLVVVIAVLYLYVRLLAPIIVKYKFTDPEAKPPQRAYHKAACWDVFAIETVPIPANQWREIQIGVAFAPWPHIYVPWLNKTFTPLGNVAAKINTRSGHGRRGLRAHLGVIDGDYRESWSVVMFNHKTDFPVLIRKGDKVAQIEFYRVPSTKLIQAKTLSASKRGLKGFGSTGR